VNLRLFFKLAAVPLRRSWVLFTLMGLSFAQVMLALWFCGGVQHEITHTEKYAEKARFVSIQLKQDAALPGSPTVESIHDTLKGHDASIEELSTEQVLAKMETEEPEIVQTVRSIGDEGLQLMPKLLLVRGLVPDSVVETIKAMPGVYRIDSTPTHHARLISFYRHLSAELRVVLFLVFFLVAVQLLVFQRIQQRDMNEVVRNLVTWGMGGFQARIPGFLSLIVLSVGSFAVSVVEWGLFQRFIWKNNAFLGELSLDRTLNLPFGLCAMTFLAVLFVAGVLAFSGRSTEE